MRVLLIGGSGFIGRFVARDLVLQGHEVAVFHRGRAAGELPPGVRHILGDRNDLAAQGREVQAWSPEVVVDFVLSSGRQARGLMELFRGVAGRVIALSSQDVYRAYEVLLGLVPDAPPQEIPLGEDSELRTRLHPYGPERLRSMQAVFPWLDQEYDKILVEREVLGDPRLPATVLRLPMVYGPGDPLHRLFPTLKRIDDRRPAILLQEEAARLHQPRGYVENVAAAVALATTSKQAAGRIYNVVEPEAFSELEWTERIGAAASWAGLVLALPREATPRHLRTPFDGRQDLMVRGDRIRDELGFSAPVPLDEALRRTIAWERVHPPAPIDPAQFDYAAEDAALARLQGMAR